MYRNSETLIILSQVKESFDDGEDDEVFYVVELKSNNDFNIHLCEGYNLESMEVIYCILRDNIEDYIDLTRFINIDTNFLLLTNTEKIAKETDDESDRNW